jgi:hypothetical protein
MSLRANGTFGSLDPHDRSERPNGWTHPVLKPSIDFSFHHSIAWDSLRDVWQTLLEHGQWNALEAFMTAAGVTGASMIRGKLHRGDDLSQIEVDHVFEKISWPGWNIVQGPRARTDEGGTDYDRYEFGMTDADRDRHRTLNLLHLQIAALLGLPCVDAQKLRDTRTAGLNNHKPDRVTSAHSDEVSDAASRLALAFNKMARFKTATFIPYTHSMWQTVNPGVVNKEHVARWDTPPLFKKTTAPPEVTGNMPARMKCKNAKCGEKFDTPNVPPRTLVSCPACHKPTMVDFAFGV